MCERERERERERRGRGKSKIISGSYHIQLVEDEMITNLCVCLYVKVDELVLMQLEIPPLPVVMGTGALLV